MLSLGIETSGLRCSIAFVRDQVTLLEYNTEIAKRHGEILGELVKDGFQRLNIKPDNLDFIAIASGPGSFTGLRIGMAFAKGLAHALEIPIISVSNFEILVFQGLSGLNPIDVIIDARMKKFYHARFDTLTSEPGFMEIIGADLLQSILENTGQIVIQRTLAEEMINDLRLKDRMVIRADFHASFLCRIASKKFIDGKCSNLPDLEPIYLQKFAGVQ